MDQVEVSASSIKSPLFMDCSDEPVPISGDKEPNILDFYESIIQREAAEDNDFINNKYYVQKRQNGSLFRDNVGSVTFSIINNRLSYDQYINEQRNRKKAIQTGKMRVNYVSI
ncbi:hypothetical protein WDU94_012224, partial [Cyamophila willieti]